MMSNISQQGNSNYYMKRVMYLGPSFFSNLLLFLSELLNINMFLITGKYKNEKRFSQTQEISGKNYQFNLNKLLCM